MPRIRDFGVSPGRLPPGPLNAITDVPGVRVGQSTVNRDVDGVAWRTGVTAVWPHGGDITEQRVYAATFPLNGYGEMTSRSVVDEWGVLDSPVVLTGTSHVGIVYHWTLQYLIETFHADVSIPMVAECWDGYLDGSHGLAIGKDDVYRALASATDGPVAEGAVGSGTGMQLFDFKGGIGTASRLARFGDEQYVVGALVMTNFGDREDLRVDGVPVGAALGRDGPGLPEDGSCIVVLGTNAPLSQLQCARLAKRASLGLARTGSFGGDTSGEIFMAFATGNLIPRHTAPVIPVRTLVEGAVAPGAFLFGPSLLNTLFLAAVEATEEAVYNALVAAETTRGTEGHVLHAIPHDRLRTILRRYGRGGEPAGG
jgi:D-aminopeptidase